ncbi:MAG: T9SS type A sorting domain-containing protein [Bacteroidota bacterium]
MMENGNNIDISQLPQGLYFLQVQLENGQMATKKLVRN